MLFNDCLKALTVLTSIVSSAYSIALNLSLAICKSFIYSTSRVTRLRTGFNGTQIQ